MQLNNLDYQKKLTSSLQLRLQYNSLQKVQAACWYYLWILLNSKHSSP